MGAALSTPGLMGAVSLNIRLQIMTQVQDITANSQVALISSIPKLYHRKRPRRYVSVTSNKNNFRFGLAPIWFINLVVNFLFCLS